MDTNQALVKSESTALETPHASLGVANVQFQDLEAALAGDLSRMPSEGRVRFYTKLCEFTGLNPLAKPFDWLTFQGKLTLYPNKGCAEQLRVLNRVTFDDIERKVEHGLLITTVKCTDKAGRRDFATAAVPFDERMAPDDRARAVMKCETKAKRRATLSLCGLTMFVRENGEDGDEVEQVTRQRLHELTTSESSTDRAALLNSMVGATTVEAEVIPPPPQTAVSAPAAPQQPAAEPPTVKPDTAASFQPPPAAPSAPPAPPAPAAAPAATTASEDTVRNLEIKLSENGPEQQKVALAYLVHRKAIVPGADLSTMKGEAVNFVLNNRHFWDRVQEWSKKQQG